VAFLERWGLTLAICGLSATPAEDLAGTATGAGAVDEAVDAPAAVAAVALPAALEAPGAALDEPDVFEEPEVLEEPDVPDEPELLEEPEEVLTGVRRDRPDERCLWDRPPELDPSVGVLSAEALTVEGAAAWDACSGGWEPCPSGNRRECEPPPCGERPPRDGSPWRERAPPEEVTCGEGWVPAGWP
jgi:hypothetical protein